MALATGTGVNVSAAYQPVKFRDTGMVVNPESAAAHAAAIRTVMLYLLTDAFALTTEERVWSGWALDEVCAPLLDVQPHTVPLAARQEMINGTYSRLLELHGKPGARRNENVYDTRVTHASANEWADALMTPVQASYTLPPFAEARMRDRLVKLLSELGVGLEENPRSATYLPTELRYKVLSDRAAQ